MAIITSLCLSTTSVFLKWSYELDYFKLITIHGQIPLKEESDSFKNNLTKLFEKRWHNKKSCNDPFVKHQGGQIDSN